MFASVFLIVEEIRECLHRRARSQWRRSKTTMDAIAAAVTMRSRKLEQEMHSLRNLEILKLIEPSLARPSISS